MRQHKPIRTTGFSHKAIVIMPILLFAVFSLCFVPQTLASEPGPERIAKMAMSTSSLWMISHHEHEIMKGLESGDTREALEEAEELVPWIMGTTWIKELKKPAMESIGSVQNVIDKLKENDIEGAKAAAKEMKMKFHHLHHELMEAVSGGESIEGHDPIKGHKM